MDLPNEPEGVYLHTLQVGLDLASWKSLDHLK